MSCARRGGGEAAARSAARGNLANNMSENCAAHPAATPDDLRTTTAPRTHKHTSTRSAHTVEPTLRRATCAVHAMRAKAGDTTGARRQVTDAYALHRCFLCGGRAHCAHLYGCRPWRGPLQCDGHCTEELPQKARDELGPRSNYTKKIKSSCQNTHVRYYYGGMHPQSGCCEVARKNA